MRIVIVCTSFLLLIQVVTTGKKQKLNYNAVINPLFQLDVKQNSNNFDRQICSKS